jgi:hypothetical protein
VSFITLYGGLCLKDIKTDKSKKGGTKVGKEEKAIQKGAKEV